MKVTVSVHGRFHGFDLAEQLHRRAYLGRLLTTYPSPVARRFLPADLPLKTAPWLELRRRFRRYLPSGWTDDHRIASAFARFAGQRLPPDSPILVGWSGATLEAIGPARQLGMKVVLERGSTHIVHQSEVLREERERHGLHGPVTHPLMIERELAEYAAADAIAVPTRFAAETFVTRGIPREKLIVNPYGARFEDEDRIETRPRPAGKKPIILFVGGIGLRKGAHGLLKAFAPLAASAELHLVGPIEDDMRVLLPSLPTEGVTFHGPLRGRQLAKAFRDADLFCLPSLEEGLPLAMLRAMAAGLPVVATAECGLMDIFADGHEAVVVPARDAAALEAALARLIADPARRDALTHAARGRIAERFTWAAYGDRAVTAYRRLLDPTGSASPILR